MISVTDRVVQRTTGADAHLLWYWKVELGLFSHLHSSIAKCVRRRKLQWPRVRVWHMKMAFSFLSKHTLPRWFSRGWLSAFLSCLAVSVDHCYKCSDCDQHPKKRLSEIVTSWTIEWNLKCSCTGFEVKAQLISKAANRVEFELVKRQSAIYPWTLCAARTWYWTPAWNSVCGFEQQWLRSILPLTCWVTGKILPLARTFLMNLFCKFFWCLILLADAVLLLRVFWIRFYAFDLVCSTTVTSRPPPKTLT